MAAASPCNESAFTHLSKPARALIAEITGQLTGVIQWGRARSRAHNSTSELGGGSQC